MKILALSIMVIITFEFCNAQNLWKYGTAEIVNKNYLQINSISPSQYGFSKRLEFQSQLPLFVKIPNFSIKYKWFEKKGNLEDKFLKKISYTVTSRHTLSSPTLLLISAKKRGYTEENIPFLINVRNEALFTVKYPKYRPCQKTYFYFTLKVGNIISIGSQNNLTIDRNAFLYRQSAMLNQKSLWYMGLQFDNVTDYGLFYKINFNAYKRGILGKDYCFEQKSLIYYYFGKKNKVRAGIGYIVDFSNQSNIKPILLPVVELSYIIKINFRKNSKSLFGPGVISEPEEARDLF